MSLNLDEVIGMAVDGGLTVESSNGEAQPTKVAPGPKRREYVFVNRLVKSPCSTFFAVLLANLACFMLFYSVVTEEGRQIFGSSRGGDPFDDRSSICIQ